MKVFETLFGFFVFLEVCSAGICAISSTLAFPGTYPQAITSSFLLHTTLNYACVSLMDTQLMMFNFTKSEAGLIRVRAYTSVSSEQTPLSIMDTCNDTEHCIAYSGFNSMQTHDFRNGQITFFAETTKAYYITIFPSSLTFTLDIQKVPSLTITNIALEEGSTYVYGNLLYDDNMPFLCNNGNSPCSTFNDFSFGYTQPQGKLVNVTAVRAGKLNVILKKNNTSSQAFARLIVNKPSDPEVDQVYTDETSVSKTLKAGESLMIQAFYVLSALPASMALTYSYDYYVLLNFTADIIVSSSEITPNYKSSSHTEVIDFSSSSSSSLTKPQNPSSSDFHKESSNMDSSSEEKKTSEEEKLSSDINNPKNLTSSYAIRQSSAEIPNSNAENSFKPTSSSSVVHRKTGISDGAVIGIIIGGIAFLVIGIVLAIFLIGSRKQKKRGKKVNNQNDAEMSRITFHMVPAAELMMPAVIPSEEPPSNAESQPLEALPIRPSVSDLTFNQNGEQAPVGFEISEHIEMKNTSNSKQRFTFFLPFSVKYRLEVSPKTAVVKKGGIVGVDVKLTFLCTTHMRETLKFTTQQENKKKKAATDDSTEKPLLGSLTITLDSKLSTRLDFEELQLYTPPIGEGSFGTVYKGTWRGAEVAVKMLKAALLDQDESVITEFMREMDIMHGLRSDFIVGFFGAVLIPGKLSLVTEFCPLGSLKSLMSKHKHLSPLIKLRFAIDCARGMHFLHTNGILHRDLKPDNLLVVATNAKAPIVCKLTDFGTSRTMSSKAREEMTTGLGTPVYMAPEILLRQPYSTGADVYSFAILLLEIFTQRTPFDTPEFSRTWAITKFVCDGKRLPIPTDCPLEYSNTILSCWAQNPAERPAFESVLRDLNQLYEKTVQQHKADVKLKKFQRAAGTSNEEEAGGEQEMNNDLGDDDEEEEVDEKKYRIRGLSILQTQPAPPPATILADSNVIADNNKAKTAAQ